jgi:peptidoglycan/xylan/chitin deacetylase (PgdA/CDA1 family)
MLKQLLYHSGILRLARRVQPQARAVILRYHSVADPGDGVDMYLDPGLSVPLAAFGRQMRVLQRCYTPVSLDSIFTAISEGRAFPPRAVAITFDDGYRDNYLNVLPILRQYNVPATFYITAGCVGNGAHFWTSRLRYYFMATRARALDLDAVGLQTYDLSSARARQAAFAAVIARIKSVGKPQADKIFQAVEAQLDVSDLKPLQESMMTWDEVRTMRQAGMLIGAHTLTHPNLPSLPPAEAQAEIVGSKRMLEEQIDAPILHFAYPNGRGLSHFNDAVKEIVRQAGFLTSVTSVDGAVHGRDDALALKRLGVYRKHARISRFAFDIERARLHS